MAGFVGLAGPSRCLAGAFRMACNAGVGAAGLAMPVFTVQNHSAWRAYSTVGYGLAYGLAYGIARAWPALSVWLRLAGGLLVVNI